MNDIMYIPLPHCCRNQFTKLQTAPFCIVNIHTINPIYLFYHDSILHLMDGHAFPNMDGFFLTTFKVWVALQTLIIHIQLCVESFTIVCKKYYIILLEFLPISHGLIEFLNYSHIFTATDVQWHIWLNDITEYFHGLRLHFIQNQLQMYAFQSTLTYSKIYFRYLLNIDISNDVWFCEVLQISGSFFDHDIIFHFFFFEWPVIFVQTLHSFRNPSYSK